MKKLLLLVFCLVTTVAMMAQKTVSGTISGVDGTPLIGVNILEVGTSNGTVTDFDGRYEIQVQDGASLRFSFTGYEEQTIEIGNQSAIDLVMEEGVALDEVVVTALGIEREKKALAYSVTEVSAENFSKAREINVLNSLSGRVAGVNVAGTATGAGGSTRVVIRGNSSLTGNNQPLYVVDGVPIDNTQLGSAGMWGGQDWGDGVSSLNPDDIETVTVLKGNTAAALYGYRASNGVILVTTKSGQKGKLQVDFTSQFRSESLIDLYDFQTEYGHGRDGLKPTTQDEALANGLSSWGGRLDGSNVIQFDGVSRPYSNAGDNIGRFYETGATFTNTLAMSGGTDKVNFRVAASNLDNSDIMPNSGLTRRNITTKTNAQLSDKFSVTLSATYVNEITENRPRLSDSPGNANYTAFSLPPSINIDDLRGPTDKLGAIEDGTEFQFNDNVFVTNPWWAAHQFEANNKKNRLLGNLRMRYDIIDGLYLQGRAGLDRFVERRRNLTPYGTAYSNFGQLEETNREVQELNLEAILGYSKDITENFGINAFIGGNQQRNFDERLGTGGNNFNVPFLHVINNIAQPSLRYDFSEFQVNSVYGSLELQFLNSIYLSGTMRNDWFSTLTKPTGESDNSKLYPSVGLSLVLSDLVDLPNWVTYGKLRGSWAEVGGATAPYRLNLNYSTFSQGHLGNALGGISNNSIPNPNLLPLTSREIEFGGDFRFFGNRLGLDIAYYDRETQDDILNAAVSATSGFGSKTVNVGRISNRGVELLLTVSPVSTPKFNWDLSFNYGFNDNEVISLLTETQDDEETLRVGESRTRNAYIQHTEGLPYSQIYGFGYARDASGNIIIDDATGLPQQGELMPFGTGVHPHTFGLRNDFRFGDFNLGILIDGKTGGFLYTATNAFAYLRGLHQNTLDGREGGIGVADAEDYYGAIYNITEEFVQSANFIRLREIVLNYNLPSSITNNLPLQNIGISLAARNLGLLYSEVENVDPESTYATGNDQGLEMFGVPQTRSLQASINIRF
ncbi:MAG: SusC/RagA family TonB-linked outer membrane protein [Bacteroidota bacterium]